MRKQYNHINITYQSQSLQFAITESGTSYRYNEEILEFIRITKERPVFVLVLSMKRYVTGPF